jgi:hypothetical protein
LWIQIRTFDSDRLRLHFRHCALDPPGCLADNNSTLHQSIDEVSN